MKVAKRGYVIAERKIAVECDCGEEFLQSVTQDLFRCPRCKLLSHRRFFYVTKGKRNAGKNKGDSK
jgi:Zn finger protein HypA/HybF involved in hydrogenase expression